MGKSFDDIFDDFMENGKKKDSPKKDTSKKGLDGIFDGAKEIDPNNLPDDMPPMVKNIIKALTGFKDVSKKGRFDKLDADLGQPDEEITSTDGDSTFSKKTWDTDFGSITRITVSGSIPPEGLDEDAIREMMGNVLGGRMRNPLGKKEVTLEAQLEAALAKDTKEGYEEAARLKKEIEKRDKNNKTSEKPENTEKDDFDDFPF